MVEEVSDSDDGVADPEPPAARYPTDDDANSNVSDALGEPATGGGSGTGDVGDNNDDDVDDDATVVESTCDDVGSLDEDETQVRGDDEEDGDGVNDSTSDVTRLIPPAKRARTASDTGADDDGQGRVATRGGGGGGATGEVEWQCAACTLRNKPLALVCDACGTERFAGPATSGAAEGAAAPDSSGEWPCRFCTFRNRAGTLACEICGNKIDAVPP